MKISEKELIYKIWLPYVGQNLLNNRLITMHKTNGPKNIYKLIQKICPKKFQ